MISFEKVSKIYGNNMAAVKDLSIEVGDGETVVLLGTSGSGKTTTLKMVNRLIEPTRGKISIDGVDIMDSNVIGLRRKIGYAIQHIGLFPHMNVGENIGVVPGLLKWDKKRIKKRVDELLSMVGLEAGDFYDRFPSQLSGGQKQRVGVARALSADPSILLMDEPFGALDPITRDQLQNEFIELESRIRKTVLFVTHDMFEAVKMGDKIALLDNGNLKAFAEPGELVENPPNEFVEQFFGKNRIQLVLMTKTVKDITEHDAGDEGAIKRGRRDFSVEAGTSFLKALDIFKKAGVGELPVYEGEKRVGKLKKEGLINSITSVLAGKRDK